jgi:H+/Cl- antiporter ClcA
MKLNKYFQNLFITLFMGVLIGLSTVTFFKSLFWIQTFQKLHTHYVFLLPIVWIILKAIKKITLYFPVNVSEVYNTTPMMFKHWNKLSFIFNFSGSVLSHFSGASIGREGVAVTLSASLAQIFKLDWSYWRAIVISAGFGIAMLNPFVAVVFLYEVFTSRIDQKVMTFIMAWVGCLIAQTFQLPNLIEPFFVLGVNSFSEKLFFVLVAAGLIGFLSRIYKSLFFKLKIHFDKSSIWLTTIILICVSIILYQPQFKNIHSLSLDQFKLLSSAQIFPEFILYKFLFTLFFVSIGFWGGDFVPSVLIGSGLGVVLAKYFSVDPTFGFMLGSFAFFCGITNLKWTAIVLTGLLVGFHQILWVYLFLTVCRWFAGAASVYTTEPSALNTFWSKF